MSQVTLMNSLMYISQNSPQKYIQWDICIYVERDLFLTNWLT